MPALAESSALNSLGHAQPHTELGRMLTMAAAGLSSATTPVFDILREHVNPATIWMGEGICDADLGCSHATRAFLSYLNSKPRSYGNA
jgi:hypothetical protein